MASKFWTVSPNDPEFPNFYWTGYDRQAKDHRFSRDPRKAIRFCRREDAEQAGIYLTRGTVFIEIELDD